MDNALLGLREEKTDAYVVTYYKGKKLKTDVIKYKGVDEIDWWR